MAKKPVYNAEGNANEETPSTKKPPKAKVPGKKAPPSNPFAGKKK